MRKILNNMISKVDNDIIQCDWCDGSGLDRYQHTCKKCDGMGAYAKGYAHR